MRGTDRPPIVSRRRLLRAGAVAALGGATAGGGAGTVAATVPPDPLGNRHEITFKYFVGVNAFVDDPIGRILGVAGSVREYHDWQWDEGDGAPDYAGYPDTEMKWSPSYAGGGAWSFDEFYDRLAGGGSRLYAHVSPCVQRAPSWLHDADDASRVDVPTDSADADPTDPQSYEAKAHHAFQLAARYGATDVDEGLLTLADDQLPRTGLGVLPYVEDWNEPNRTWDDEDAEFSPAEYAAMSSAACDGHAGTLEGPTGTYGVKNADKRTSYVMGGIAGIDLEWIQALDDWYAEHRPDGEFVPDVINLHHYCHSEGEDGPALSPEADDLRGRMEAITSWRDEHYDEVEVWLSEFGWDTHPESVLRPPDVPGFTREQVQGQFLVRAYLELAAAGVDRAHAYMLRDVDPEDPTQYSTCGLVTQKGEWEPKPAWYYVATMRDVLANTRYAGERDAGHEDVRVYEFQVYPSGPESTTATSVYAVWCPTSDGTTVAGYELELGTTAVADSVEVTELADGEPTGERRQPSPTGGSLSIDVSESPVFVRVINQECPGFHSEEITVDGQLVCDVNGDELYRDVDADGRVGQRDVAEFFQKQHREEWKRPELFDFSGNGEVTHGDVVDLFDYVALN